MGEPTPAWNGWKEDESREEVAPLMDVCVVDTSRNEAPPPGYEPVDSANGRRVVLGAGLQVCARRWGDGDAAELAADRSNARKPVVEMGVLWPAIGEECPPGWTVLRNTPAGHSALLPGLQQGTVLLCLRRGSDKRAVGGLCVVRRAEVPPAGYTSIETSVSVNLEANLSARHGDDWRINHRHNPTSHNPKSHVVSETSPRRGHRPAPEAGEEDPETWKTREAVSHPLRQDEAQQHPPTEGA